MPSVADPFTEKRTASWQCARQGLKASDCSRDRRGCFRHGISKLENVPRVSRVPHIPPANGKARSSHHKAHSPKPKPFAHTAMCKAGAKVYRCSPSRAKRGSKARQRRKKRPGMTRQPARQSETKSDRRLSDSDLAGCGRLRQGAPDGDGRYSALNQMACIGERMAHLTAKTKRDIGAALELKRQSASCNRGQYRPQR